MSFTASLDDIIVDNANGLLAAAPHWPRVRLGDVVSILNGFPFPSSRFTRDRGVPLLRIRDVLRTSTNTCFDGPVDDQFLVQPGELVVGMDGDFNASLWRGPVAALNQRVCKLSPDERYLDRRFLSYVLPGYLDAINAATSSITVKHLSSKTVADIPLPLPPLGEQRRMVAALEEHLSDLDAAVAGLERARANVNNYRRSVLDAAVCGALLPHSAIHSDESGPELLGRILAQRTGVTRTSTAPLPPRASIPDGWAVASLEQLTDGERVICYGILMPKEHIEDGVRYVKVRDMRGDRIDVASLQRTSPEIEAQYARARLRPHDLLLSIRGTYGRVVEVPPELDGGNITQDTARLAVTPLVDRGYIALYLRSPLAQAYFQSVARGVAVKGVNIADVRAMPVLLPPRSEQQCIRRAVEHRLAVADRTAAEIDVQLARAKRLRRSILKRAFEGKLVAQNLGDEPASALLDRIRAGRGAVASRRPRAERGART